MQVIKTNDDLLAHITAVPSNHPMMVGEGIASLHTSGSYSILGGMLTFDWSFTPESLAIHFDAQLHAFSQTFDLGAIDINADKPTGKLGGTFLGVKAEIDAEYQSSTHHVQATATVAVPLLGSRQAAFGFDV